MDRNQSKTDRQAVAYKIVTLSSDQKPEQTHNTIAKSRCVLPRE